MCIVRVLCRVHCSVIFQLLELHCIYWQESRADSRYWHVWNPHHWQVWFFWVPSVLLFCSFECHILSTTPIYICSHPKTSLNSLTPHRNSISGQRGSKSRVSEHESSAPPVNMYGTTSLSWCVLISTFIYEKWLILELVNEWIGSLRHIQRYFIYTCDGT